MRYQLCNFAGIFGRAKINTDELAATFADFAKIDADIVSSKSLKNSERKEDDDSSTQKILTVAGTAEIILLNYRQENLAPKLAQRQTNCNRNKTCWE